MQIREGLIQPQLIWDVVMCQYNCNVNLFLVIFFLVFGFCYGILDQSEASKNIIFDNRIFWQQKKDSQIKKDKNQRYHWNISWIFILTPVVHQWLQKKCSKIELFFQSATGHGMLLIFSSFGCWVPYCSYSYCLKEVWSLLVQWMEENGSAWQTL